MSRKDPIIEEIHAVREAIAREADYDFEKMLEAARARQAAGGLKSVGLPLENPSHPREGFLRGEHLL